MIADEIMKGQFRVFDDQARELGNPVDWHRSIVTGQKGATGVAWWQLPDFDTRLGDVKGVWELSRASWAPILAQAAAASGNPDYAARLNDLIVDWAAHNPPFLGLNWKCGQEASFRVLNLLLAARLLSQDRDPEPGLVDLVYVHLRRIRPTILYAIAQDNNHGTSEAAALFVGGAWAERHLPSGSKRDFARSCAAHGRKWLENRARRLVLRDGGFSQYSVTYHRVFLDTMVQAEEWRARLELTRFSSAFYKSCSMATGWLAMMVNARTGDSPNLGPNDSANLFRLDEGRARDFRPSVVRAAQTFPEAQTAIPLLKNKTSKVMDDFGVAILNPRADGTGAYAYLRFPNFRFRPGQADFLHFDLWTDDGVNLLRDGGSFSYSDETALHDFPGIGAHNTVQFDGREPMRKLTRFLYGDWVKGSFDTRVEGGNGELRFQAGYRDFAGASHERSVLAKSDHWRIADRIGGYSCSATLRWRLAPGEWRLDGNSVAGPRMRLSVSANGRPARLAVVTGWESLHYLSKAPIPVFEAEFEVGTTEINTEIVLTPS